MSVDDAFEPPDEAWVRLSPKLITARRITLGIVAVAVVAALIALAAFGVPGIFVAIAAAVLLAIGIWVWWLIGRRVRSYGYVERDDDFMVTSGILFRRLVIVPYGRMQLVDLVAGPIDRALGITTVQLHTAAATSDAAVPGLEPEIAAALRDRLAARGETREAGL